jgi:ornithine carrier protein
MQEILQKTVYPASTPLPFSALLFCGAASGAFTSLLLTPVELIKCKMQVPFVAADGKRHAPGVLALILSVFRHDGIMGFWRGQLGTLIRETGGSAAWFGSYEGVSALFRTSHPKTSSSSASRERLPVYQQMIAGACAGISYNFIFYPADTIKSRMQTEDVSKLVRNSQRPSFLQVGTSLWRQHGLAGLYRGCGITVARSAPSSAFIFAIYEGLRHYFS